MTPPAIDVPLRRDRVWLGKMALLLLTVALPVVMVSVVATRPGVVWLWIPAAVGVYLATGAVDAVAALFRPTTVRLSASGIDVCDAYTEASLAWDDVGDIDVVRVARTDYVVISPRDGAPSWRFRNRRIVWRGFAGPAKGRAMLITWSWLQDPARLTVILAGATRAAPADRPGLLAHYSAARQRGPAR